MTVTHIANWSVEMSYADPYLAPEQNPLCLVGFVTGHPRKEDGKQVRTTPIVSATGRTVTTESGTVYRLGRIHSGYRKYLRKIGRTYNRLQPITVKGSQ